MLASQLLPKPAYSITTLPSNGSPPTSSTRLPAGFSRGGNAGLGLTTPSAWTSIGGAGGCVWVGLHGPCGGSQGAPKGHVVDGVAPRTYLAGGLARSHVMDHITADVTLHKCGYLFSRAHVVGLG